MKRTFTIQLNDPHAINNLLTDFGDCYVQYFSKFTVSGDRFPNETLIFEGREDCKVNDIFLDRVKEAKEQGNHQISISINSKPNEEWKPNKINSKTLNEFLKMNQKELNIMSRDASTFKVNTDDGIFNLGTSDIDLFNQFIRQLKFVKATHVDLSGHSLGWLTKSTQKWRLDKLAKALSECANESIDISCNKFDAVSINESDFQDLLFKIRANEPHLMVYTNHPEHRLPENFRFLTLTANSGAEVALTENFAEMNALLSLDVSADESETKSNMKMKGV